MRTFVAKHGKQLQLLTTPMVLELAAQAEQTGLRKSPHCAIHPLSRAFLLAPSPANSDQRATTAEIEVNRPRPSPFLEGPCRWRGGALAPAVPCGFAGVRVRQGWFPTARVAGEWQSLQRLD